MLLWWASSFDCDTLTQLCSLVAICLTCTTHRPHEAPHNSLCGFWWLSCSLDCSVVVPLYTCVVVYEVFTFHLGQYNHYCQMPCCILDHYHLQTLTAVASFGLNEARKQKLHWWIIFEVSWFLSVVFVIESF